MYRRGKVHSNQLLVVRVLPNEGSVSRFGFVVGKVVGGAVVRNRVKRRLREAVRGLVLQEGFDVVIGARKRAADADFRVLSLTLAELCRRSGVLSQPSAPEESN